MNDQILYIFLDGAHFVEGVWAEVPLIVVQSLCLPQASVELFRQGGLTSTIVTGEIRQGQ